MIIIWLQECCQEDKEKESGDSPGVAGAHADPGPAKPRPHLPAEQSFNPGANLLR